MSTIVILGVAVLMLAFVGMLLFSRLRLRTVAIVLAGVGLAYTGAVFWFSHALDRAMERRNGPRHVFAASGQTKFLIESVALGKARETLLLDGFTNGLWSPVADRRTAAPDGQADTYLARNTLDPKKGFLLFTNGAGAEAALQLSIEGSNIICQRVASK